jgi:hypothetical protein
MAFVRRFGLILNGNRDVNGAYASRKMRFVMGVSAGILRLGVAVAAVSWASGARADNYRYTNIAVPEASELGLSAFNDDGQVIGVATVPGSAQLYQAFIWKDGVATLVPGSAGFSAINNKGIAVGDPEYPNENTAPGEYVTYDSATGTTTVHDLKLNAPVNVVHLAENGELFGQERKFPTEHRGRITPFSYKRKIRKYRIDGDKGSILRGANDAGDLLVQCRNPKVCIFDLYSNGSFAPILAPGSEATYPYAIMPSGQIVGYSLFEKGPNLPFVETNGSYQTYPDAPYAYDSEVVAILSSGSVFFEGGPLPGQGYVLVNGKYHSLAVPGAVGGTEITDVNARGDLLGFWVDAQNTVHYFYAKCAEGKICTAIKN